MLVQRGTDDQARRVRKKRGAAGSAPVQTARMHGLGHSLALTLFATGIGAAHAEAPDLASLLPAGRYALASRMLMPHLDEMRRIVDEETRCLAAADMRGFFPVMRQPALNGCAFGFPQAWPGGLRYVLVCHSARVATGTAALTRTRDGLVGDLQIKMGGKNMTFSQRVEGRLIGTDCSPPLTAR